MKKYLYFGHNGKINKQIKVNIVKKFTVIIHVDVSRVRYFTLKARFLKY